MDVFASDPQVLHQALLAILGIVGIFSLVLIIVSFRAIERSQGKLNDLLGQQGSSREVAKGLPTDSRLPPSVPSVPTVTSAPSVPLPQAGGEPSPKRETGESVGQLAGEPHSGWIARLRNGLRRTHGQMVRGLDEFFLSRDAKATREDTLEKLFEVLVQADVGVATSERLVERVRIRMAPEDASHPESLKAILKDEMLALLKTVGYPPDGTLAKPVHSPHVVLMVGVNGVGKTTTTGKLAFKARQNGQSVIVGAADTFRAAAAEQLAIWADRAGATLVRLSHGADPASVAFESVKLAKQEGKSLCIVDTAGRLHNRQDLMQELAKVRRVLGKEMPGAPHETLLVLDATTGQNAVQQAKIFKEVVDITGLVLTKLDGTAKGGVALAIVHELGLPICYVGVGESVDDLEIFRPEDFLDALFSV